MTPFAIRAWSTTWRLGVWILFLACSPAPEVDAPASTALGTADRLIIYTVNYPLQYFAERIGGESVSVVFPAPPGVDPADWSPEPEEAVAYQNADLILRNGAGYAGWVDRTSLIRRKLIDTSAGIADRLLPLDQEFIHTHGPDGAHSHAGTAFTTWLDPTLAIEQARAIADALSESRPRQRDVFMKNLDRLERDLERLDQRLEKVAGQLSRAPLVFSHPVYQYLEARYGLNGRSLHWEPDQTPDPESWQGFEALLETHPARLMIWEAAPRAETQRRLAALGVATAVYAPCSRRPETADWLGVMESNVAGLEAFFLENIQAD